MENEISWIPLGNEIFGISSYFEANSIIVLFQEEYRLAHDALPTKEVITLSDTPR